MKKLETEEEKLLSRINAKVYVELKQLALKEHYEIMAKIDKKPVFNHYVYLENIYNDFNKGFEYFINAKTNTFGLPVNRKGV